MYGPNRCTRLCLIIAKINNNNKRKGNNKIKKRENQLKSSCKENVTDKKYIYCAFLVVFTCFRWFRILSFADKEIDNQII